MLGDYPAAIDDLTRAMAIDPTSKNATRTNLALDEIYMTRARCYVKIGKDKDAIEDYTAVIKMEPDSEEAYKYRGDCYARTGDSDKAIADYSNAIKYDIESPGSSYYARSLVFDKLGRKAEAEADRKKAAESGYVRPAEKQKN